LIPLPRLIKRFSDESILEYDSGGFDAYCVYLTQPGAPRYAPKDVQYFERLQVLGRIHGAARIYRDFVEGYEKTAKRGEEYGLALITKLTEKYGGDALEMDKLLTTIYAGMVAEENKAYTKLGKKVKRLGVHQLLMEGWKPDVAANFSKGKKWRDILKEYEVRTLPDIK
jgi:hypothetical protein